MVEDVLSNLPEACNAGTCGHTRAIDCLISGASWGAVLSISPGVIPTGPPGVIPTGPPGVIVSYSPEPMKIVPAAISIKTLTAALLATERPNGWPCHQDRAAAILKHLQEK